MKVNVYDLEGNVKGKVDLPEIFDTPYRPDVIKKAFWVAMSNKRQPYGADPLAGKRHACRWPGKGRGMARIPRLNGGIGRAVQAPNTVGGRRAHPPKAEKIWEEKINKKERKLAIFSSIACTKDTELVRSRGHKFKEDITLPVVIEDKFKDLSKTKEVLEVLEKVGVIDDIERAKNGKKIRAGKGKRRGRRYKVPKSILIVSDGGNIFKSARNLPGVDVVEPSQLNIIHLAPGGVPGRLMLITENALKELGGC